MIGFFKEFAEFLNKYKVIGLAVAFIIGAASNKLVSALVNDIVMPLVSLVLPGGDWRASVIRVGSSDILIGDFLGSFIDFLIVALVIFFMVKFVMREEEAKK